MWAEVIVAVALHAQPAWEGRRSARRYDLRNDGTIAEEIWNPAIHRTYLWQWPHWDQKVPIPGYWKPGFPLPKPIISPRVKKKYGEVYFEDGNAPEPLPARPLRNDRAIGEVDQFGTILH